MFKKLLPLFFFVTACYADPLPFPASPFSRTVLTNTSAASWRTAIGASSGTGIAVTNGTGFNLTASSISNGVGLTVKGATNNYGLLVSSTTVTNVAAVVISSNDFATPTLLVSNNNAVSGVAQIVLSAVNTNGGTVVIWLEDLPTARANGAMYIATVSGSHDLYFENSGGPFIWEFEHDTGNSVFPNGLTLSGPITFDNGTEPGQSDGSGGINNGGAGLNNYAIQGSTGKGFFNGGIQFDNNSGQSDGSGGINNTLVSSNYNINGATGNGGFTSLSITNTASIPTNTASFGPPDTTKLSFNTLYTNGNYRTIIEWGVQLTGATGSATTIALVGGVTNDWQNNAIVGSETRTIHFFAGPNQVYTVTNINGTGATATSQFTTRISE